MFGVGRNRNTYTRQIFWRLLGKQAITIFSCFDIVNPHKKSSVKLDFCKATKLVSVKNGEYWLLREEEEARRAETPGTVGN